MNQCPNLTLDCKGYTAVHEDNLRSLISMQIRLDGLLLCTRKLDMENWDRYRPCVATCTNLSLLLNETNFYFVRDIFHHAFPLLDEVDVTIRGRLFEEEAQVLKKISKSVANASKIYLALEIRLRRATLSV